MLQTWGEGFSQGIGTSPLMSRCFLVVSPRGFLSFIRSGRVIPKLTFPSCAHSVALAPHSGPVLATGPAGDPAWAEAVPPPPSPPALGLGTSRLQVCLAFSGDGVRSGRRQACLLLVISPVTAGHSVGHFPEGRAALPVTWERPGGGGLPRAPRFVPAVVSFWTPHLCPGRFCGLCPPVLSPSEQRGLRPRLRPSRSSWRLLPAGPSVGDLGSLILISEALGPELGQLLAGGWRLGGRQGLCWGRSRPRPREPGPCCLWVISRGLAGCFSLWCLQGLHLQTPPPPCFLVWFLHSSAGSAGAGGWQEPGAV